MVDSVRVKTVVEQISKLSAAEMKLVASFGKVKGYSQDYLDLKESLRSMVAIARHVYEINLEDEFNAIEPIVFTGMIPNDVFNRERRRIVTIGGRLVELIEAFEAEHSDVDGLSSDGADGTEGGARVANPKIYVSVTGDLPVIRDLKRCLTTADCELIETDLPATSSEDYNPMRVAERFRDSDGALIFLMPPSAEAKPSEVKTSSSETGPSGQEVRLTATPSALSKVANPAPVQAYKPLFASDGKTAPPRIVPAAKAVPQKPAALEISKPLFASGATLNPLYASEKASQRSEVPPAALSEAAQTVIPHAKTGAAGVPHSVSALGAGDAAARTGSNGVRVSTTNGSANAALPAQSSEPTLSVVKFDQDAAPDQEQDNEALEVVRARLVQNVLVELGIALGRFPERTFFVVHDDFVPDLPSSVRDLISFYTNGEELSFEEGQMLARTFKKSDWALR